MSTNETTPFHIWKHEVQVAAIANGATAEWLAQRFEARLPVWYRAGETVRGAVDMIDFTRKQEPKETTGENEAAHLRVFLRRARESASQLPPHHRDNTGNRSTGGDMSTKAIREALDTLETYADTNEDWEQHAAAMAAVQAIEKAAKEYMLPTKGRVTREAADRMEALLESIAKDAP